MFLLDTDVLIWILRGRNEVKDKVSKLKEEFSATCQIAILNVDSEFTQAVLTGLEPKVVVLYGDNKDAGAKILDKESISSLRKFSVSKDKLPEEREVVTLG